MGESARPGGAAPSGRAPAVAPVAARLRRTAALAEDVGRLRYVNASRAEALARLGVRTVGDLLAHEPRRYHDFTRKVGIGFADVGREATVVGRVDRVRVKRPRPRLVVVELSVVDETGVMQASFFRQPWVAEQVHEGDLVALSGKVGFAYGFREMRAPFMEVLDEGGQADDYARVLPVHPVGEGVSAAWMRRIVSAALATAGDVCDFLPARLVAERGLMSHARAIRARHFPATLAEAEVARRRLAYEELLCLQLALRERRRLAAGDAVPCEHVVSGPRLAALREALPFSLTDEQERAAAQILADMAAPRQMSRLLLGDVGTGKTAVAALALGATADTGTQAAMMAPTSVLARQYAEGLGPWLDAAGVAWALVVGATASAERAEVAARLAAGEPLVVFGTTALLSSDLDFARLTLVVIDEQHRFGVGQRSALRGKGPGSDLLAMTATPIPRTLALSFYGDLALSRIARRPRAGSGVSTASVTPENLDLAYGAIREEVAAGRRAYVVCPLIDEADAGADMADDAPEPAEGTARPRAHAALATVSALGRLLPDVAVGLLHGRMTADEKDAAMERFRSGATPVLVCTTVVEVGVDVPEATVMLVYDADRFGLATLHQLRGRVGRGEHAGRVFLETSARRGTPARRRLDALEATSDGMELAQLDLRLRHEGDVLGVRQHGVTLRSVDLVADEDLVAAAHDDAARIAEADPGLAAPEHAPLAREVRRRHAAYFDEMEG